MLSNASQLLKGFMKGAPVERWLEFWELGNWNFMLLQRYWMMNVERKFGEEASLELDSACYGRAIEVISHRVRDFLNLSGDDLSVLAQVYQLGPAGSYIDIEFTRIGEHELLRRVRSCPMQLKRRQQDLPELACKPPFITAASAVARAINPAIKVTNVLCPPDPHPEDLWCECTFIL